MAAPSTEIEVDAACILIQMAYTITPAEVVARFSAEIAAATQQLREPAVPASITPSLKRKRKQSLVPRNIKTEIRSTSGPGNLDGYEWTSSPESAASGSSDTAGENRKEAEYQRQPNKKNASNMSLRGKLKVPAKLQ